MLAKIKSNYFIVLIIKSSIKGKKSSLLIRDILSLGCACDGRFLL